MHDHRKFMKQLTAPVAGLVAVALVVGVTTAVGNGTPQVPDPVHVERVAAQPEVHKAGAAVSAAVGAFTAGGGSAVSVSDQARLRNALGGDAGFARGAIEYADFSQARSAPIEGSTGAAWIVPSGDQVCLVLADPGNGLASTCQTVEGIKAGRGVLALTPRADSIDQSSVVAVVVPDGGTAPTLKTSRDTETLSVHGNVAATIASAGDELRTAAGPFVLAKQNTANAAG
jgi:hypothetical protein